MTTGVELISQIAILSCEIENLNRCVSGHPMSILTTAAYRMRDLKVKQRNKLRKNLAELPDLTFS